VIPSAGKHARVVVSLDKADDIIDAPPAWGPCSRPTRDDVPRHPEGDREEWIFLHMCCGHRTEGDIQHRVTRSVPGGPT